MRSSNWLVVCAGLFYLGWLGSAAPVQAEDLIWETKYIAAKERIVKLLAAHPHFRDKLASFQESNSEVAKEWVEYLAAAGDHNTNTFIEQGGRRARPLVKIHEEYPEELKSFREWVRDNARAAVDLFGDDGAYARINSMSGIVSEQKRKR